MVQPLQTRAAITETPVLFGADENLLGILTRPAAPAPDAARPVVILLNAGVVHRIGPHRLHVTLARRLADVGFTAFRLDLSGIGDSPAPAGGDGFEDQAVNDVRAAIDRLHALVGATEFVLFGLCAGADNAIATGLVDTRVRGLVLVDSFTYATMPSRRRKLVARVREHAEQGSVLTWGVSTALRAARGRFGESVRHGLAVLRAERDDETIASALRAEEAAEQNGRIAPPAHEHGERLARLASRGVAMFAVFSGCHDERYNAPGQLFERFPELTHRLDERFFPEANHTFTELDMQASLLDAVVRWVDARWSDARSGGASADLRRGLGRG